MATISYTPKGVCSRKIDIEVEDGIVKKVHFTGGCNGNTQGVSKLVEGMKVQDVIDRLEGIVTFIPVIMLLCTAGTRFITAIISRLCKRVSASK